MINAYKNIYINIVTSLINEVRHLHILFTSANVGKCPVSFIRIGCFKDNQKSPRPLPELLFTDKDKKSNLYSGKSVNFEDYDSYGLELICRCAKKALASSRAVFGLQNYGEDRLCSFHTLFSYKKQ